MPMRTVVLTVVVGFTCVLSTGVAQTKSAAAQGFERLKQLEGDWIDAEGVFGSKGAVAVTYRVTGGGHTVVETFPIKTPQEMVTVYHLDGNDVVLTHYCSGGTQPRMRSKGLSGNVLAFDYDGGANIDAAKTSHMHSARLEFISPDEMRGTWENWNGGKPDHSATFRIIRKK
jgi:hypothetical protein